jgi:hypothetical protein
MSICTYTFLFFFQIQLFEEFAARELEKPDYPDI